MRTAPPFAARPGARRSAGPIAGALVGAWLSRGAPLPAQESPAVAEARVHFDRAVALFESGDAAGALVEFQRAYDLSGRSSLLYNLGATYQAMHDYPRAIDALRRYVASGEGRPTAQRALALRALEQMEPLVAHLRIVREPPDAAVSLDGRAFEGDRATVGPGTHILAATATGHEPRQIEVAVASGDDREVRLSLPPVPPPVVVLPVAPPPVVAPPAPLAVRRPDAPAPHTPGRGLMWSMVATSGALAVGASVTGAFAFAAQGDYATRHLGDPGVDVLASRGRTLSWTADLLGLGAVAAGVTALVLGLRAPPSGPTARVALVPTRGGAWLTAAGRF